MKNNILLVEINRVNELIGNKKILNEQWVYKIVTGVLRFVDDASKRGWKVGASVENEIAALSKAASDEEAIKILAKISNSSKEFQDIILPEVMKSLSKEVKDEILNITNLAKKELDSGKSIDDVNSLVDKQMSKIKSDFEGVNDILKKQIKDELSTYKPNTKPTPEPIPDSNLKEKMTKAFNQFDDVAPGVLSVKDKLLLTDSLWFRGFRAKMNAAANQFFKKEDASIKRITELMKTASERIDRAEYNNQTLFKAIDSEIENLRKNEDFVKEQALSIINSELSKKIGWDKARIITDKLKNAQSLDKAYPEWLDSWWNESYIANMRKFPRFGKNIPSLEGKKNWGAWISSFLERSGMFLTLGNPRKLGEITQEFIRAYGKNWGYGIIYYWAWMQGIKRTVFPAIKAFIDWNYYSFSQEYPDKPYGKEFIQVYGHFIKERIIDTFFAYDKEFDKQSGLTKYEKSVGKSIIKNILPWELLWDDVLNFADWHTEGGLRQAWDRYYDAASEKAKSTEAYKKAVEASRVADSIKNVANRKIDSINQTLVKIDSTLKEYKPTTDTNEIKNLLKDWMNANGWKNSVGDYDFEYMKNMGDNKWSYESSEENDDGTPKMYYFLFDPIKKTFKGL
jgi:hypothetical protein